MEGFIQLHRKMLDWEWYEDINTKVLFIHLLLKANWKDKNWRGQLIERGSFITSYQKLSDETGLSLQQVRTSINKLKSTHDITYLGQASNSLIKLTNYNEYQGDNTQFNTLVTGEQHTSNTRVTTTNKDNNNNNKENKEIKNNINSKELTTEVETFGNQDINNMQNYIKQEVENIGYIYKSGKYERIRIKNILTGKQINEIAEKHKMTIYEFVGNIFKLSSKLDFWNGKINNAETFYKHYDKIYNDGLSLKAKQVKVVDYGTDFGDIY